MIVHYCSICREPVGDYVSPEIADEIRQDGDDPDKYGWCNTCGVSRVVA